MRTFRPIYSALRGRRVAAREARRARADVGRAWRTSSTTRRPPRSAAPPRWATRSRCSSGSSASSSSRAWSARTPSGSCTCSARRCARSEAAERRGALAAADAEDAMGELLEAHGVERRLAARRAARRGGAGRGVARRGRALRRPGAPRGRALGRGVARPPARSPTTCASAPTASRTSSKAIKAYTYMDQAVAAGGRRPRRARGDARRSSATSSSTRRSRSSATTTPALPRVCVYGSELNQVWTNLLDNAIDALGEQGTITITTAPWHDGGRRGADRRRRPGHPRRPPAPHLRAVLHDQGGRLGHRARPRHGAPDRRSTATTATSRCASRPGDDDVHRAAAAGTRLDALPARPTLSRRPAAGRPR